MVPRSTVQLLHAQLKGVTAKVVVVLSLNSANYVRTYDNAMLLLTERIVEQPHKILSTHMQAL